MRLLIVFGWLCFVVASIELFWIKYDFYVNGETNWIMFSLVAGLYACAVFLIRVRNSKL